MRDLWTIEDVAGRLGTSARHIRRLVSDRRIPFTKVGHLLRFVPEDIDEWVAEHRVPVAEAASLQLLSRSRAPRRHA